MDGFNLINATPDESEIHRLQKVEDRSTARVKVRQVHLCPRASVLLDFARTGLYGPHYIARMFRCCEEPHPLVSEVHMNSGPMGSNLQPTQLRSSMSYKHSDRSPDVLSEEQFTSTGFVCVRDEHVLTSASRAPVSPAGPHPPPSLPRSHPG